MFLLHDLNLINYSNSKGELTHLVENLILPCFIQSKLAEN